METAAFAVGEHLPMMARDEYKELFVKQVAKFNSYGLTGTHDAAVGHSGTEKSFFEVCRELEAAGEMNIRIYTAVLHEVYDKYVELGVGRGYGSDYCRVGGVKYFQDGSIQGFTGWLLDDYHTRRVIVASRFILKNSSTSGLSIIRKMGITSLSIATGMQRLNLLFKRWS